MLSRVAPLGVKEQEARPYSRDCCASELTVLQVAARTPMTIKSHCISAVLARWEPRRSPSMACWADRGAIDGQNLPRPPSWRLALQIADGASDGPIAVARPAGPPGGQHPVRRSPQRLTAFAVHWRIRVRMLRDETPSEIALDRRVPASGSPGQACAGSQQQGEAMFQATAETRNGAQVRIHEEAHGDGHPTALIPHPGSRAPPSGRALRAARGAHGASDVGGRRVGEQWDANASSWTSERA
jgi:hypothetical protein